MKTNKLRILFFVVFCLPLLTVGQSFIKVTSSIDQMYDGEVYWVDLDNDGDKDLFMAGFAGNYVVKIYDNQNGTFVEVKHAIPGASWITADWADYDLDGDMDLVLGHNARISLYKNTGDFNFQLQDVDFSEGSANEGGVKWADFDLDGDPDLLAVGDSKTTLYENKRGNEFIATSIQLPGLEYAEIEWTDLNNDLYPDLVMLGEDVGGSATTNVYLNEAGISFKKVTNKLLPETYGASLDLADVNGDGRGEILYSGMDWKLNRPVTRILNNDGQMNFSVNGQGFKGVDYGKSRWVDYDNDGDQDFFIIGSDYDSQPYTGLYRNDGGVFTEVNTNIPDIESGDFSWFDADGDNDLDLAIAGSASDGPFSGIFENRGNSLFINRVNQLPALEYSAVRFGDYDADGDQDIAIMGSGSEALTKIYRNDGSNIWTDIDGGFIGKYSGDLAWIDYDGDNDLDLVVFGYGFDGTEYYKPIIYTNNVGVFENSGIDLGEYSSAIIDIGDYDNNGAEDILLVGVDQTGGSYTNCVKIFKNNGGTFTSVVVETGNLYTSCEWGDYDHDNDLDFVVTGGYSTKIFRNDGSDTFVDIAAGLKQLTHPDVTWGDYDGDNDLDLLLAGSGLYPNYYNTELYENKGGDVFEIRDIALKDINSATRVSFVDYNNDSKLDIFIKGYTSDGYTKAYLYYQEGDTFKLSDQTFESYVAESHDWADMDNDDYPELIMTGSNQTVLYKNAKGALLETTNSLENLKECAIATADINNDGRIDVFMTGSGNANYIVYQLMNMGDFVFEQKPTSILGAHKSSADFGDFNKDGNPDLVVSGNTGSYKWETILYKNDGNSFKKTNIILPEVENPYIKWLDMDGDGYSQYLVVLGRGYPDTTAIYKYQAGDTLVKTNIKLPNIKYGEVKASDLDGDGLKDLVIAGSGYFNVFKNLGGDHFFNAGNQMSGLFGAGAIIEPVDLNKDGLMDLILSGQERYNNNHEQVYLNKGGEVFERISDSTGIVNGEIVAFDYDNDDDWDLVKSGKISSSNNGISTLVENSDGIFKPSDVLLTNTYEADVAVADYDLDGDEDLLLMGYAQGSFSAIYKNNLSIANTVPTVPSGLYESVSGDDVTFNWSGSTDAESSLITYNIKVVHETEGPVISGNNASDTQSGLLSGNKGNAGYQRTYKVHNLAPGNYQWAVQAIDMVGGTSEYSVWNPFVVAGSFSLPKLDTIIPGFANSGEMIRIHGQNFSTNIDNVSVKIGGVEAEVADVSYTSLLVKVPEGLFGLVPLDISIRDQHTMEQDSFLVFGELNWVQVDTDFDNNLEVVEIASAHKAFAGGPGGYVIKTMDAGDSWSGIAGISGDVKDILFLNADTGYIATSLQRIYRTFDGGNSWSSTTISSSTSVNALARYDDQTLLAGTGKGELLKSTNKGLTWTQIDKIDSAINDIIVKGTTIYALFNGHYLRKYDINATKSVEQLDVAYNFYKGYIENNYGIFYAENQSSYYYTDYIFASTITWDIQQIDTEYGITGVDLNDEGYLITNGGEVFFLEQLSKPWLPYGRLSPYSLNDIKTFKQGDYKFGIIVGDSGRVFRLKPTITTAPILYSINKDKAKLGDTLMVVGKNMGTDINLLSVELEVHDNDGGSNNSFDATVVKLDGDSVYFKIPTTIDDAYDYALLSLEVNGRSAVNKLRFNIIDKFDYHLNTPVIDDLTEMAIDVGDLDNDGDMDIIVLGKDGANIPVTRIYQNVNGQFSTVNHTLPGVSRGDVALGDMDNDGDLDVFILGKLNVQTTFAEIFENNGGFSFSSTNSGIDSVYFGEAKWGDLNHDGLVDIIYQGRTIANKRVLRVYKNDGNNVFTKVQTALPQVAEGFIQIKDLDFDGVNDVLLSGIDDADNSALTFFKGHSDFSFTQQREIANIYRSEGVVMMDYANDLDFDLVYSGYEAQNYGEGIYFYMDNKGDDPENVDWGYSTDAGSYVADFNNDGRPDVANIGRSNGRLYFKGWLFMPNLDVNDFLLPLQSWYANEIDEDFDLRVLDFDLDNDLDIILTGVSSVELHRSSYIHPNKAPKAPPAVTPRIYGDSVVLSWNEGTDDLTPEHVLTYNLKVGTTSGGGEVVMPTVANNRLTYLAEGNAGWTNKYILKNLPKGDYFVSVQSVDASYLASDFSTEVHFAIHDEADLVAYIEVMDTVIQGMDVTIPLVVGNSGGQSLTGDFTAHVYLSADNMFDAGDELLFSKSFTGFEGSAYADISFQHLFTTNTPVGDYYLLAIVDPDNSVIEYNEGNNQVAFKFYLSPDENSPVISTVSYPDRFDIMKDELIISANVIDNIQLSEVFVQISETMSGLSTVDLATMQTTNDTLFTYNYQRTDVLNNAYDLYFRIVAKDAAGNESLSEVYTMAIWPDTLAPGISFLFNTDTDYTISQKSFKVITSISDYTQVVRVALSYGTSENIADSLIFVDSASIINHTFIVPITDEMREEDINYYIKAYDRFGNDSTSNIQQVVFTPDFVAPDIRLNLSHSVISRDEDITVKFMVEEEDSLTSVTLYYGLTNALNDTSIAITSSGPSHFVFNTSTFGNANAITIFAVAKDYSLNEGYSDTLFVIRQQTSYNLKINGGSAASDYVVISNPFADGQKVSGAFAQLGAMDGKAYGMIDYDKWVIYDMRSSKHFVKLNGDDQVARGTAYFILSRDGGDLTFSSKDLQSPFLKALNQAWTLIGNPYPFDLSWTAILEDNPALSPFLRAQVYTFDNGKVRAGTTIPAFGGAFVFNSGVNSGPLVMNPNAFTGGGRMDKSNQVLLEDDEWILPMRLEAAGWLNEMAGIGIHPNASEGVDKYDVTNLPRFIGYVDLVFDDNNDHGISIKPISSSGMVWHGTVKTNLDGPVIIQWPRITTSSSDRQLFMIDEQNQTIVNMSETDHCNVNNGARLKFVFASLDQLPEFINSNAVIISAPYPNPATQHIQLNILAGGAGNLRYSITGLDGKVYSMETPKMFSGGVQAVGIPLDELAPGIYVLTVLLETEGVNYQRQFKISKK